MEYELTVNIPTTGRGETISILGLGEFENGKTHIITSEQAAEFKSRQGIRNEETGETEGITLGRANFPVGVEVRALKGNEAKAAREAAEKQAAKDAEQPSADDQNRAAAPPVDGGKPAADAGTEKNEGGGN